MSQPRDPLPDHGGTAAVAAAVRAGADTLWTLSGAHIFPLYDAATRGPQRMRILDVRHEQTAVFGAEAQAKLTRRPGFAALTAGPGVTNGVSAITTAWFNGSPLVVLGGRAPAFRWGSGALQELDHPPILSEVTKHAATVTSPEQIGPSVAAAFALATSPHRGPVFLDVPMDHLYTPVNVSVVEEAAAPAAPPAEGVDRVAALWAAAARPLLIIGSDVWIGGAEQAARQLAETTGTPTITNGMGRGVLPGGHPLLATRARSTAVKQADLVVVVGAPLDFRLGYGSFGSPEDPAAVVHIVDAESAQNSKAAVTLAGDLAATLAALTEAWQDQPRHRDLDEWRGRLRDSSVQRAATDRAMLEADTDPIHPGRVYGELLKRLTPETTVVGDGGDFVSFAGRFIEPELPGRWLDPGPYGCLGTGLGYAAAARLTHPSDPVVLLLGDGAAGFSLMDVDTLVRHQLPVVMVVGNNGVWGLEKHPMQMLYGYDVAADLQPETRYDEVVRALGGGGETVTSAEQIGPALDRAFQAGVPYLVNVITDPAVAYPRTTTGI